MQPPFDASIATTFNYTPSDEERVAIKNFIQSRRKELKRLDENGPRLSLQSASITKSQADVKEQIEQEIELHQALLSPARTLPDDVYREIFLWCLANSSPSQRTHPLSPPLLLTQVCIRWTKIAHSTPRLWTNLHIRYHDPNRTPARTDVVEQWMLRSGALPISVVCEPASDGMLQPAHIGLFAALAPSFSRWKDLTITLAGKEPDINALLRFLDASGSSNPFHQAEALDLTLLIDVDEDPQLRPLRVAYTSVMHTLGLHQSTRLRKCSLVVNDNLFDYSDGVQGAPSLSSWLPRGHLQYLSIRGRGAREGERDTTSGIQGAIAYQLLRDLPNLIRFQADFDDCAPDEYPPNKYVLKSLEHLSFTFLDFWGPEDLSFLPYFEFPSVTFLTLKSSQQMVVDDAYDEDLFVIVEVFFSALWRSLTKLILEPGMLPAAVLITNLPMLPFLIHLHLKQPIFDADYDKIDAPPSVKWGDAVLECLTPKAEQTTPTHSCPDLQYLKWENNTWFSDQALANLILQRASSLHSSVPLKQVHINFGRCIQQDMRQEYAELVRQGLDLRLNYLPQQEARKSNVYKEHDGHWRTKYSTDLDADSDPRAFGWP